MRCDRIPGAIGGSAVAFHYVGAECGAAGVAPLHVELKGKAVAGSRYIDGACKAVGSTGLQIIDLLRDRVVRIVVGEVLAGEPAAARQRGAAGEAAAAGPAVRPAIAVGVQLESAVEQQIRRCGRTGWRVRGRVDRGIGWCSRTARRRRVGW